MKTVHTRHAGLAAGFTTTHPEADVPELRHLGEHWAPRAFEIGRHQHRGWEIYLQLAGSSVWRTDTGVQRLEAGQASVTPPGLAHALHEKPRSDHHYAFAIFAVEPVLERIPTVAAAWKRDDDWRTVSGHSLHLPFRQLLQEVSIAGPFRGVAVRLALDQLVVATTRALRSELEQPLLPNPECVLAARRAMDSDPGASWTVPALAKRAGVSAGHLTAAFKKAVGQSPHQYLISKRIELAVEQLRGSDRAVTSIALELGFASSQHFARVLRKVTGTSARELRRHRG